MTEAFIKKTVEYGEVEVDVPKTLNDREVAVRIAAMIDGDVHWELTRRATKKGVRREVLLNRILRTVLFEKEAPNDKV